MQEKRYDKPTNIYINLISICANDKCIFMTLYLKLEIFKITVRNILRKDTPLISNFKD